MQITDSDIQRYLIEAIEREAKRITNEVVTSVVDAAIVTIEEKVRNSMGGIAATVVNKLSFERFGTDLRITVHFPDAK